MVNFRNMLKKMKESKKMVLVHTDSQKSICTGYIDEVGEDCLVISFSKDYVDAVIPLDKIIMVSYPQLEKV